MWVLFLVFVSVLTGEPEKQYQLEKYTTSEKCMSEARRIAGEMEKAYPGEQGMELHCKWRDIRV